MPEFIRKVTWKGSSSLHSPKYQQMQFCQVRHIILRLCVHVQCLLESGSPGLRVWSSSVPFLNTSTSGTTVLAEASGTLHCGSQGAPTLFFEMVHCHLFWAAHFQPHFPVLMHPTIPKDVPHRCYSNLYPKRYFWSFSGVCGKIMKQLINLKKN